MKQIDCQGLACPAPVLKTKEAIDKDGLTEFTVIVDNEAARQNVSRFFESRGFNVTVDQDGSVYRVSGRKAEGERKSCAIGITAEEAQKIMVLITSDCMGRGDDLLGSKLMAGFLKTLKEMGDDLWRIALINNGARLAVEGSSVLDPLRELRSHGLPILVCGTCLTHFNLMDKLQVGEVTNMLDIVTAMQVADKVITI